MRLEFVVAGVVVDKDKVLLRFHPKLRKWLPPGGHVQPGETPDEALRRELREETGLIVELMDIVRLPSPVEGVKHELAIPFYANVHSIQMDFMAIDEKLQVYKCPGELYGPQPDGIIRTDGRLDLRGSNWFESVSFSPTCAAKCVYGPICYGGCRWLAGGPKHTFCSKRSLDATIGIMLKAYVYSKYRDKLLSETTDVDAL